MTQVCWIPLSPDQAGNYLATPGRRYATLINVDARAPLSSISDALKNWNLDVTYSWQSGQPTRQQFLVDRWLASLPAPADGKTWMYFEMNFTGDVPRAIVGHLEKCFIGICGAADIAYVFEAQEVADDYVPCGPGDSRGPQLAPPNPGCPVQPFPWKPALVGGIAGAALGFVLGKLS